MMGGGMMGMMGGGMGGMMGGGFNMSALPSDMDPNIASACLGKMSKIMQFDWTTIGGCVNAVFGVSEKCSGCGVTALQGIMGKTMFDMPSSCMGTCMSGMMASKGTTEAPGTTGAMTPNPECQKCMKPHMM